MLYEIINPSDPYTIEAPSLDVALVACLFLGSGQYGFKPIDGGAIEIPLFLLGGHEEYCQEHFGCTLDALITRVTEEKSAELAKCFESCLIGYQQDRSTYKAGLELIDDPAKREQWRDRWLDEGRSSMNNIGGRAYKMAAKLRAKQKRVAEAVPQQVFVK